MKSIIHSAITFFAIILIASSAKSQDTLFMKSGEQIASQIIEVSASEIKYKKADNPDGPVFITPTFEISSIKYKNGTVEVIKAQKTEPVAKTPKVVDPHPPIYPAGPFYKSEGRRFKERDMHDMVRQVNDSEIDMHVKKARNAKALKNIGFVAIPAFAFGIGYSLFAFVNNESRSVGQSRMSYAPGVLGGVVAAGTLATSIAFGSIRKNNNKAAIKLYNEKY